MIHINNIQVGDEELKKDYKIMLHKMTEAVVGEITYDNVSDFKIDKRKTAVSELDFTVPSMISGMNGDIIVNPLYNIINGYMLVSIDDTDMYVLRNPEITYDEKGTPVKRFRAYSREYELSNKKMDGLEGFDGEGKMLYDPMGEIVDGEHIGFFNYVEDVTSWKVNYVTPDATTKRRGLKISNTNLLNAIREVEKVFEVIAVFNTMDKTIDLLSVEQLGMYNGLDLSSESLVKSIRANVDYDGIVTRLYGYGEDDITIASVNNNGQPFVEDISFFVNEEYMTKELIEYIGKYNDFVKSTEPIWEENLKRIIITQEELSKKIADYNERTKEINIISHVIDGKMIEMVNDKDYDGKPIKSDPNAGIGNPQKITEIITNPTTGLEEYKVKYKYEDLTYSECINRRTKMEEEREVVNEEIKNLRLEYNQIRTDNKKLQVKQRFTDFLENEEGLEKEAIQNLERELDPFIIEESFKDDSFSLAFLQEMKDEMEKELKRKSTPRINLTLDVFDFVSDIKTPMSKRKLNLGDIVRVDMTEYDKYSEIIDTYLLDMRLIGYTHDPINETLKLQFADLYSLVDTNTYFLEDILGESRKTTTKVSFNESQWNKGKDVYTKFNDFINSELDLSKQSLITADGQKPILDDRGFWMYRQNEDGNLSDEQVRIVNNVIAITKDNWETVEVAITPNGVVAENIYGTLGAFAKVNAGQIQVSPDFFKETDIGVIIDSELGENLRVIDGKVVDMEGKIKDDLKVVDDKIVSLDGTVVKQNVGYNNVFITPEKGITIKDQYGNDRLQIGQWDGKHYGIRMNTPSGERTILDERGILQVWQDSKTDNISNSYPMRFNVYIPQDTREIYDVMLRYYVSKYRACLRSTQSGGGESLTESSYSGQGTYYIGNPSGIQSNTRTEYGGDSYLRPKTGTAEQWTESDFPFGPVKDSEHNHGVKPGTNLMYRDNYGNQQTISWRQSGRHYHTYDISHTHYFNLPTHSHYTKIITSDHTHPPVYGVVEVYEAPNIRLTVNGSYVGTYSGYSNASGIDINIKKYVSTGWNTIEFSANGNTRVDATVFNRVLVGFDGIK